MSIFQSPFNNVFIQQLPADSENENYCRQVSGAAFSFVNPTKTKSPSVVALNVELARQLKIDINDMRILGGVLTGNDLHADMKPYAMNYGGHQFGHWAGQLGDGRAINLGQLDTDSIGLQTLQLKGAGVTPYSRNADGLAVLRSSIREYLCSEAMHHLGISTTRALSLCLTGDQVLRDMFYDGNSEYEHGAIVCRVSSSFMRFGSFQLPSSRDDIALLKQMVDYNITQDFPHLGEPSVSAYIAWFKEISERTCQLVVDWMRVGFVHGVMNTDNMSIIGETIDYGPYGWIDDFDLNWTPNTTDAQGRRYSFGAQPEIAQWNLFQLANAIFPLIQDATQLNEILSEFATLYEQKWRKMMANKLGLECVIDEIDSPLFIDLEKRLSSSNADMTIFYRTLVNLPSQPEDWPEHLQDCFYEELSYEQWSLWREWLKSYQKRKALNTITSDESRELMNSVNPQYVLRNYLAQQAIEKAEQGDYSMIDELYLVLQQPYKEQVGKEHLAKKRPDWAKHKAGCSMLSCSS